MLINNLYDTNEYFFNNNIEAVKILDLTFNEMIDKKLSDSYLIGYVPYENYPSQYYLNDIRTTEDNKAIMFYNIFDGYNIGWGFASQNNPYNSVYDRCVLHALKTDGTLYDSNSDPTNNYIRFINKIKMGYVNNVMDHITLNIKYLILPIGDEPADDNGFFPLNNFNSTTLSVPVSEYQQLMTDDNKQLTLTVNFDSDGRVFKFSDTDFNDSNVAKIYDMTDRYVMYLIINGFSYNLRSFYAYDSISSECSIGPFFQVPIFANGFRADIKGMFYPADAGEIAGRFAYDYFNGTVSISTHSNLYFADLDLTAGNFPYIIDADELSDAGITSNRVGIINGKYLIDGAGSQDTSYLFRHYSQCRIEDGWKIYNFYPKSYDDHQTYLPSDYFLYNGKFSVSLFDENNCPLSEREPTLSSYPEMYDKLQIWQRLNEDIKTDEFSPDDIPEWEPEPGEEDEDTGDDIYFNRNVPYGLSAFISNYVLTPSEVQTLGQQVWTKVKTASTSDMIKNFYVFKTNFNPDDDNYDLMAADILNYFISLKYYPFNVEDKAKGVQTSDIYVGTGTEAIDFGGSKVYQLQQQMIILDGGSATLPNGFTEIEGLNPSTIQTFLDHEPHTSVSVYVPFCGTVSLPPSLVMGSKITLTYCVDLTTGGCMAIITKDGNKKYPVAAINGTIGFDVMLTGNNAQTVQANANNAFGNFAINMATSGLGMIEAGIGGMANASSGTVGNIVGQGTNMVANAAHFINNLPKMLATSPMSVGTNSTMAGLMTPLKAYVQIRRHVAETSNFDLIGYQVDKVGTVSGSQGMGYIQVINPRLDGIPCTQAELEKIRTLLANGIWMN